MIRTVWMTICAVLLSGCSMLPGRSATDPPVPRAQAAPIANSAPARQCLAQLSTSGVQFTPLADRYTGQGCSLVGTVQLATLQTDLSSAMISNLGPVTCDVGTAFAAWARFGVDRAARQILGSPLQSIETMGSYACRDVAGTGRRSGHATAAAIDIGGFVLQDGRRISVERDWNGGGPAERQFLRVVQDSACKRFATVLGPDYNAAHRDHLHVEGVTGGPSYCR